jgi:GntR family transcriptional regulator of vanillate catabolism
MLHSTGAAARDRLVVAQSQHRGVLQAIEQGQGARAEALMQEHARQAHQNLNDALRSQQPLQRLPGAGLLRRGGDR